jgi:glucose/arabinose dehydrogenase
MRFRKRWQKCGIVLLVCAAAMLALFFPFNPRGYRARIVARLLRTDNDPIVVTLPPNFQPRVPPGFSVSVLAKGFEEPRWLAIAPNGDLFVTDSGAGKVIVLHDPLVPGANGSREVFADHLTLPFGIAFHDDYVYVADTNEVVRFRYDPKTSRRLGDSEHILDLPGLG